ncbi:unnamed protein product [Vitrella brassicaformis CCMP3155]|uniref:Nucleolus and neural progenitor protein-like N-terminal domain-containing protein n=2 Tax=Vitrella brassicaformis TaxID=1169539 RepID=A0A0G4EW84_VITBC|nr:unnamed protein product [Vitrella brassicaformis CCMP3155]|eukprot:CEM02718.1 unnamed protein product [Vitrella brassicaformis CCMP3155]
MSAAKRLEAVWERQVCQTLPTLRLEHVLLQRLIYKHGNQHRRKPNLMALKELQLHMDALLRADLRAMGAQLQLACSTLDTIQDHDTRCKVVSLGCGVLTGFGETLRVVEERVRRAAVAISQQIAHTFFLPMHLAAFAALSRCLRLLAGMRKPIRPFTQALLSKRTPQPPAVTTQTQQHLQPSPLPAPDFRPLDDELASHRRESAASSGGEDFDGSRFLEDLFGGPIRDVRRDAERPQPKRTRREPTTPDYCAEAAPPPAKRARRYYRSGVRAPVRELRRVFWYRSVCRRPPHRWVMKRVESRLMWREAVKLIREGGEADRRGG